MNLFRPLVLSLLLLVGVAQAQGQLTIITSLFPYASLADQVAGERAQVIALIPPGVSEHTYDPTPRDMARINQADLFILNGGLDAWLERLIGASGSRAPILEALELVEFTPVAGHEHTHDEHADDEDHAHDAEHGHGDEAHEDEHAHDDEAHEGDHAHDDEHGDEHGNDEHVHDDERDHAHDRSGVNPHIWLTPHLMAQFVPHIADALAEIDPEHAAEYRANAAALIADLEALDSELMETLAPVRGQAFVPFHDAWPYFAARYGLDLIVEIEPAPGLEPSARYIAYALGLIEGSGARAIFSERQLPPRPAEVVAENAGLPLYIMDPVGGLEDTGSYQALLRYNAHIVLEALAP